MKTLGHLYDLLPGSVSYPVKSTSPLISYSPTFIAEQHSRTRNRVLRTRPWYIPGEFLLLRHNSRRSQRSIIDDMEPDDMEVDDMEPWLQIPSQLQSHTQLRACI